MGKQIVMSAEEYRARMAKGEPSKYRNQVQTFEGQRYHSKAELAFEFHLRHLRALGKVAWWTRQVPFYMPGGGATEKAQRYLCDFLVVEAGYSKNRTRLIDIKGVMTPNSKTKISVIQATHGVTVELVKPSEVDTWI